VSSTIDNVECPNCGKDALMEQDTKTCETHTHCPVCGYDSDIDDGLEDYYDDTNIDYDFEDDEWDGGDIIDEWE